jgi:hypothetical protein
VAERALSAEDDAVPTCQVEAARVVHLGARARGKWNANGSQQLVAERQAELIETMIMRLQVALKFEKEMNGILVPEVTRSFELLDRMLMDHFRVLQELGVEPKRGSMAPG